MRGFDFFTLGASMLMEESVGVVDWVTLWLPFVFAEELFQDLHFVGLVICRDWCLVS